MLNAVMEIFLVGFCEKSSALISDLLKQESWRFVQIHFSGHISELHTTQELQIFDNFWQWVVIAMHQYLKGFLIPTVT